MMQVNIRRCLSLMLALVLTFSLLPVSALAEDEAETIAIETTSPTETTSTTEMTEAPTEAPEETTSAVEETEPTIPETTAPLVVVEETAPVVAAASEAPKTSAAYQAVQAKIAEILETYKITKLTEEEIPEAVADMDEDTWFNALIEVEDLENSEEIQALTEEELLDLTEKNPLFCAFADAVYERAAATDDATIYATTVTVLDGQVSVTDDLGKGSESGGTVTVTAKGGVLSKTTNKISVTNNSGVTATLSFDYSVSNADSYNVNGVTTETSGTVSALLKSGESISITITSKAFGGTVTLTLSNFILQAAATASDVTILYDNSLGSVTADGNAVAPNGVVSAPLDTGTKLVATANTGTVFLGWVDTATSKRLSTSSEYTLKTGSNTTVKAAFASANSKAWFLVDNTYMSDDLNVAVTRGSTIVLLSDGTLPDKTTYSIPSGDTLLIPYDASHSIGTDYVTATNGNNAGSAFRTLKVPSGTTINVNGTVLVNARSCIKPGGQFSGSVYNGYGKMVLDGTMNIKNGGSLNVRGYIVASDQTSHTSSSSKGRINVSSGGSTKMPLQMTDWRGGSCVSKVASDFFPINSYYLNNIMVKTTYETGACLYVVCAIEVTALGKVERTIAMIGGTDALFHIENGSVITDYQYNGDRMLININGKVNLLKVKVDMNLGLLGDYSMTTEGKQLPLASQMTITMESGANVSCSNDIKLLPGAQIIGHL